MAAPRPLKPSSFKGYIWRGLFMPTAILSSVGGASRGEWRDSGDFVYRAAPMLVLGACSLGFRASGTERPFPLRGNASVGGNLQVAPRGEAPDVGSRHLSRHPWLTFKGAEVPVLDISRLGDERLD